MKKTVLIKLFIIINSLLISPVNNAQMPIRTFVDDVIEEISVNNYDDDEIDWSQLADELSEQIEEPINLNKTTQKELERLPFLTDIQIENLLAYLYLHGPMQTLSELMLVEEMDYQTIRYLTPFVCVKPVVEEPKLNIKKLLKTGRNELITRLTIPLYQRRGYVDKYLGPPVYNSVKYSFNSGKNLAVGFVAEKDGGEPLGALHNKKGYDYYSFYLLIQQLGVLKTLAVGNYQMSFGQGLVMNSSYGMGNSGYLFSVLNRNQGIRKHASTDEYNYFRGIGATLSVDKHKRTDLSVFYSNRSLDGVVNEAGELTSIYKTGLHRTDKESEKRNAAVMQLIGTNINSLVNNVRVGFTAIYYFMNRSYQPTLTGYAKYNLCGNNFYNIGIDYAWRFRRFFVAGEVAKGTKGYATLNQFHYDCSSQLKLSLVHRYYAHHYWALYARSFGESSKVQNENGWYMAASYSPWRSWNFQAALDFFSFPWWSYRISKPSQGISGLFRVVHNSASSVHIEANYRFKIKERDVTGTQGQLITSTTRHSLRLKLNYLLNQLFSLRTVADYNRFAIASDGGRNGVQITQSIVYNCATLPLSSVVQGSYFNTTDYDSRVYISERNMLSTFYTPSFYGIGFRWSTYVRYDFNTHFMAMAKVGQTIYQDRQEIGSGNDLIAGNRKADVEMLLRIKF